MISALADEGFDDDQILVVYLGFNSFRLGFLLLKTSAKTSADPDLGDGASSTAARGDAASMGTALPGGLRPARRPAERRATGDAEDPADQLDPLDESVAAVDHPGVHRLAGGLARDVWSDEFGSGLEELLDRVARLRRRPG